MNNLFYDLLNTNMQMLPLVMNIFKKGLVVPVMLLGFLSADAQNKPANNRANNNKQTPVQRLAVDTAAYKQRKRNLGNAIVINGTVTDAASHQPLRAISVTYQDYSAAITDSVGHFKLKVPNENVTIVLQAEGFQTKEIALKGRRTITAALYEDTYTSFYDEATLPY